MFSRPPGDQIEDGRQIAIDRVPVPASFDIAVWLIESWKWLSHRFRAPQPISMIVEPHGPKADRLRRGCLPTALSGKKGGLGNLSYSKRKLLRKGRLERCQSCRAVRPGGKSTRANGCPILGVTGRNGMPLNCTSPICRRSSLAWPARLLPSLNDRFFNSTAVMGNHRSAHRLCYS